MCKYNYVQRLSNKLAKMKKHAATYASLIIEELDPVGRSSIEVTQTDMVFWLIGAYASIIKKYNLIAF
jgi:hypothetical protein